MSIKENVKNSLFGVSRVSRGIPRALLISVFSVSLMLIASPVYACCGCSSSDCSNAGDDIDDHHDDGSDGGTLGHTKVEFDDDLEAFQEWLIGIVFDTEVIPAMGAMTTQMSAVAVKYTEVIGSFLDAQTQMDTQRLLRVLQHQTHKDYRPSQDFCMFGSNVRSFAATGNKGRYNTLALSRMSLARQLGEDGTPGGRIVGDDYRARWNQFITTYCDVHDNNYQNVNKVIGGVPVSSPADQTGLSLACDHDGLGGASASGAEEPQRINRDVNYTRLIDNPRMIDVDFTNSSLNTDNPKYSSGLIPEPGDEEDVIAMSKNLYGHRVLSRSLSRAALGKPTGQKLYLALRGLAARRGVAQASFNAIVGLKSVGATRAQDSIIPTFMLPPTPPLIVLEEKQTQRYLAAIMKELLPPSPSSVLNGNIFDLIGYNPSYYSQLEIMAKRIYQNPDFYANLYDTPVNVTRKKVAMMAIELMVDREIYESQLRREMSISVLLSSKLKSSYRSANSGLSAADSRGK